MIKTVWLLIVMFYISCTTMTYRYGGQSVFPRVEDGSQLLQGICIHSIDSSYGFTPSNPVRVGGGPSNERLFLSMICGPDGQELQFGRIGSFDGFKVLVDGYEVSYNGLDSSKVIYIDMYTYNSPMVPVGFNEKDTSKCDQ